LVVGGAVSAVRVAYFEGVFHRGFHSSVFIAWGRQSPRFGGNFGLGRLFRMGSALAHATFGPIEC
jgi:hypothetical protein